MKKITNITYPALAVFAFACLALLSRAQASPEKAPAAPETALPGFNTADGDHALFSITTGVANAAFGWYSLFSNTDGSFNTAVGAGTLLFNVGDQSTGEGVQNTAVGAAALLFNTAGSFNAAFGDIALLNNTIGSFNTALGSSAGDSVTTATHVIAIGTTGANVSHSCYIGNIFNQSSPSGLAVFVNSDGKLGTIMSSRRFKEDIKPMDKASEAILALQPVAFRYKKDFDPTGTAQFGLVAEDVAKVNPDLVVQDKEGKPYSVRYDQVNAMLLNEFLKEHRKVEQLTNDFESKLAEQQKQIEALTAGLQKVSAQIEMSRPAPQMVVNNQ